MPCLFQRDFTNKRNPVLLESVTPGCEWVINGEGVATRKWDGTAVLVLGGQAYARLDCKSGKTPPEEAIPCDPAPDPVTGHWPHWIKAGRPEDKWIRDAFERSGTLADGTYEAVGPKIGSNHECLAEHRLYRHGDVELTAPRTFAGLREYLSGFMGEGIVFHHPDGRMCKIRRDDFGYRWPL